MGPAAIGCDQQPIGPPIAHAPDPLMPGPDGVDRELGRVMVVRCKVMPWVVQRGRTKPAPLPSAGQMAPKRWAEAVLWSLGADGRVPRLAQRRVILFFCPIRASSANQISRGLPPTACRISSRRAGKFF